MPVDNNMVLWSVETADEHFYMVSRDDDQDWTKQLAAALGLKMTDPLPKPLNVQRMKERVVGRVETKPPPRPEPTTVPSAGVPRQDSARPKSTPVQWPCPVCKTDHDGHTVGRNCPGPSTATPAPRSPAPCGCGDDKCTGVQDENHQCGGPRESCGVPGCPECGFKHPPRSPAVERLIAIAREEDDQSDLHDVEQCPCRDCRRRMALKALDAESGEVAR